MLPLMLWICKHKIDEMVPKTAHSPSVLLIGIFHLQDTEPIYLPTVTGHYSSFEKSIYPGNSRRNTQPKEEFLLNPRTHFLVRLCTVACIAPKVESNLER